MRMGKKVPTLKIKHNGHIKTVELDDGEFIIGRDANCNIVLDSEHVSRRHCALRVKGDSISLRDLGSANGTFLNGIAIKDEVSLSDGDILTIGDIEIVCNNLPDKKHLFKIQKFDTGLILSIPSKLRVTLITLPIIGITYIFMMLYMYNAGLKAIKNSSVKAADQIVLTLAYKNAQHLAKGNYLLLETENINNISGVKNAVVTDISLKVLSPLNTSNLFINDPQSRAAASASSEEVFRSPLSSDGLMILAAPIRIFDNKEGIYKTIGVARIIFSPSDYAAAAGLPLFPIWSLFVIGGIVIGLSIILSFIEHLPIKTLERYLEAYSSTRASLNSNELPSELKRIIDLINYKLRLEKMASSSSQKDSDKDLNKIISDLTEKIKLTDKVTDIIVKHVKVGIIITDGSLNVENANDTAASLLEIEKIVLNGNLKKQLPEDIKPELQNMLNEADISKTVIQRSIRRGGTVLRITMFVSHNDMGESVKHLFLFEAL